MSWSAFTAKRCEGEACQCGCHRNLLLLDEPAEGLAPIIVKELASQLRKVKEEGMTMILTEQQHLDFMMKLGDSGYIIDKGEIKYYAPLSEIKDNEEIKRKFLAV